MKSDNDLYSQARGRIERNLNRKNISDKEIIIEQEKEILYYREKIEKIKEKILENELEININDEDYIIRYSNEAKQVEINAYLIKLINDKSKFAIVKEPYFKILNKTREEKWFKRQNLCTPT